MTSALFIAILSASAQASAAHELSEALGRDVQVSIKHDVTTVEYCPDNTCEVFSLRGKGAIGPLQDFAFAYLFAYSTYTYLERFQSSPQALPVLSVLARYREFCLQGVSKEDAKCVVSWLIKRHDIRAKFVRYDEGKKYASPISLGAYSGGT